MLLNNVPQKEPDIFGEFQLAEDDYGKGYEKEGLGKRSCCRRQQDFRSQI